MINSEIIGNNVSFHASITSLYFTPFNIYFIFCNISYNYGKSVGAAYNGLHFAGKVYFNYCLFQGNKLEINTFLGGPAFFPLGVSSLQFYTYKCSYIDNFSSKRGGANMVAAAQLYEIDCIYINITAIDGGALMVASLNIYSVNNGLFINNKGVYGGAINLVNLAIILLYNCSFIENTAKSGAVIIVLGFQNKITV